MFEVRQCSKQKHKAERKDICRDRDRGIYRDRDKDIDRDIYRGNIRRQYTEATYRDRDKNKNTGRR